MRNRRTRKKKRGVFNWLVQNSKKIHPWKSKWNLNITQLKGKIIFQTSIVRFLQLIFKGVFFKTQNCLALFFFWCFFFLRVFVVSFCWETAQRSLLSITQKGHPFCSHTNKGFGTAWMSQEVSKWLVNGSEPSYKLGIYIYWGYNPIILTFDPNIQRDIP